MNLNNTAIFQGYYGIVLKNRVFPVALFTSEKEATKYANGAEVKKFPASSLLIEALRQCS